MPKKRSTKSTKGVSTSNPTSKEATQETRIGDSIDGKLSLIPYLNCRGYKDRAVSLIESEDWTQVLLEMPCGYFLTPFFSSALTVDYIMLPLHLESGRLSCGVAS